MKRFLTSFLLSLFYFVSVAQNTVTITTTVAGGGSSGSSSQYGYLNAEDYGFLPSNTAAQNVTAWNTVLYPAAVSQNKSIKIGAGTFQANDTLTLYNKYIHVEGAGKGITNLKTTAAKKLFVSTNEINIGAKPAATIKGITFDGNSIGTIAIDLHTVYSGKIVNCEFKNFTTNDLKFTGVLIYDIDDCIFLNTPYSVDATWNVTYAANLVTFSRCKWFSNTRAITWDHGAGVIFDKCDFEWQGANGDANTGVFKFTNMSTVGEYYAASFLNCWLENNGGNILDIGEGITDQSYIVDNTLMGFSNGIPVRVAAYGIKAVGSTNKTNIIIRGTSTVKDLGPTASIHLTGAKASVVRYWESVVDTASISLNSGAKHYKYAPTEVTTGGGGGGTVTNLLTNTEAQDNAAWTGGSRTITANAINGPTGTLTADKIVETSATGVHSNFQGKTLSNGQYTFSIYLKAGERTIAAVSMSDDLTGEAYAYFNLSTGGAPTVGSSGQGSWTGISASIEDAGSGWYRCIVTGTKGSGSVIAAGIYLVSSGTTLSYAGNTSNGLYAWGAQLVTGSSAGTYTAN